LWKHQSKLGANLNEVLYNTVHATQAKNYWKKKGGFQVSTAGSIDWEAVSKRVERFQDLTDTSSQNIPQVCATSGNL